MIPFEELDNTASQHTYRANAEQLIETGWARKNYPLVSLASPIPWALAGQDQRSWNFHLQSLDLIDGLLRGYSHFNDERYLAYALPVTLDWISVHSEPQADKISPFAWYDMAVGLRAYRMAYLLEAADAVGLLADADRQSLWASLEQHAAYLADDANIAFHNNHGYYQIAGQLAMGRRFASRSEAMAQAQAQGRERLKGMLTQQFSPDGVHREHSPDYHRMVYDTLKALIDSGLVEEEETIAFARRIEEALSWFVYPNQHIVNFGDSDDRSLARQLREAEGKWTTPAMRFWVSGGKVGEPPAETSRAFRAGGYWVVRKPAADPARLQDYSYLALNAAFHSRTHKHADDLSFVWFDRGANILVDAGRYGYIGKAEQGSELWLDGHWYSDPWRVYCESTRAHNTLEFDGLNFPRKGVKPYGSALGRAGQNTAGLYFAEAECRQFGSIRHARVLFFMPGKWLVVLDWFKDNRETPHTVRQWFHLGHQLQAVANGDQVMVALPASEQPLLAASLLSGPTLSRLFIGEEEPVRQGWWSAKERDIVPNYAFNLELGQANQGVFATLFCFAHKLQADHSWSKVNISGRKGQLRWKADGRVHALHFERPAEGEFVVHCESPAEGAAQ